MFLAVLQATGCLYESASGAGEVLTELAGTQNNEKREAVRLERGEPLIERGPSLRSDSKVLAALAFSG